MRGCGGHAIVWLRWLTKTNLKYLFKVAAVVALVMTSNLYGGSLLSAPHQHRGRWRASWDENTKGAMTQHGQRFHGLPMLDDSRATLAGVAYDMRHSFEEPSARKLSASSGMLQPSDEPTGRYNERWSKTLMFLSHATFRNSLQPCILFTGQACIGLNTAERR